MAIFCGNWDGVFAQSDGLKQNCSTAQTTIFTFKSSEKSKITRQQNYKTSPTNTFIRTNSTSSRQEKVPRILKPEQPENASPANAATINYANEYTIKNQQFYNHQLKKELIFINHIFFTNIVLWKYV